MYHRFEENKYPSTNIRIDDFKKHIKIIENEKIEFIKMIAADQLDDEVFNTEIERLQDKWAAKPLKKYNRRLKALKLIKNPKKKFNLQN